MKITVCIGSYCHVKGSRYIIERIHQLITEKNLAEKVELAGAFCMGAMSEKGRQLHRKERIHSCERRAFLHFTGRDGCFL